MDFLARGYSGKVSIHYSANQDPASLGFDYLNLPFSRKQPQGFPVCEATVSYDGDGYHAIFGWVQIVNMVNQDDHETISIVDVGELFKDTDTPFLSFGKSPTLFDAPCSAGVDNLDWTTHSFLVMVGHIVETKEIHYVAGFDWGFQIINGNTRLKPIQTLTQEEWRRQLPFLQQECPGWDFRDG